MGVLYLLSQGASARKDGGRLVIEKDNQLVGRMSMQLAKSVVGDKIRNQYHLLKSYTRSNKNSVLTKALNTLKAEKKKIDTADSADSLRGIEGNCAKIYLSPQSMVPEVRRLYGKALSRIRWLITTSAYSKTSGGISPRAFTSFKAFKLNNLPITGLKDL